MYRTDEKRLPGEQGKVLGLPAPERPRSLRAGLPPQVEDPVAPIPLLLPLRIGAHGLLDHVHLHVRVVQERDDLAGARLGVDAEHDVAPARGQGGVEPVELLVDDVGAQVPPRIQSGVLGGHGVVLTTPCVLIAVDLVPLLPAAS